MSKTFKNASVIANLILMVIAIVIRWAIFEPIFFVGSILFTIGDSGLKSISVFITDSKLRNDQILKQ